MARRVSTLLMWSTVCAGSSPTGANAEKMPRIFDVSSAAAGPLPATSPTEETERPVRQVDHVEEVAADRSRLAPRCRPTRRTARLWLPSRQERLLDFRGDLQLVLDARLLERLAVEPRVFDGHAGFGGQRIERRAGVRRQQAALLAASRDRARRCSWSRSSMSA